MLRVGTVAQALLRALAGQLIESRRARAIERRSSALSPGRRPPRVAGLRDARQRSRRRSCARSACAARRDAHTPLPLGRARAAEGRPSATVSERLERERGIGPWSVGVVCLEGLGRKEYGLVGDLGLVQLMIELEGRWVEGHETAALLEPYGEWAGLASVYLLAGFGKGLIPCPSAERIRRPPQRIAPAPLRVSA